MFNDELILIPNLQYEDHGAFNSLHLLNGKPGKFLRLLVGRYNSVDKFHKTQKVFVEAYKIPFSF